MKKFISIVLVLVMALSMCIFTGCGGDESEDGITTITWYIPGVLEGADVGDVMAKVNELLAERYQLKLDLICIDNKNYNSKLQVINAGQEEYDLFYVKQNFSECIKNGVLTDITDMLPEIAPETYKALDKNNWDAVTVDGRIYGVPNWQVQAYAPGIIGDKSKYDTAGVNPADINSLEDITEYLTKIHEIEPDTNIIDPWWETMAFYYGFETVMGKNGGAIRTRAEGKPKVINQYASKEFKEYITTRRQWVEDGIVADYYENNHGMEKKGIQRSPMGVFFYKPSVAAENSLSRGYPCVGEQFGDAVITTGGIRATMTGISTTSKHPKEALKMIEVIYTDAEIYNLLCWGIEGKHYTKGEDGKITIVQDSGYDRIANWKIGPVYNSLLLSNQEDSVYEETKEFNESAIPSPLLGFNFDSNPVSSELANIGTVINKELQTLEMGLVDPEKGLKEFLHDLDVAGFQKVIDEMQKQIDEWWKTKNK